MMGTQFLVETDTSNKQILPQIAQN